MSVVALGPGTRLRSAVCSTEVVVVKPPSDPAAELTCGGEPMLPADGTSAGGPAPAPGEGTQLGKRYEDPDTGLEVLCSKAGPGTLALGSRPLVLKGTKPLPASD